MTKYDERFKLEVVQRYLSGDKGYKTLAREFGVGSTQVEQWVASYKRHGADGLRRKGHVKYSAQFKLEALERRRCWTFVMQEPSPVGNASIMRVVSPPSYHVRRDATPRCRLRRFPNLRRQNPNRILAPESNCSRKLSTCARR